MLSRPLPVITPVALPRPSHLPKMPPIASTKLEQTTEESTKSPSDVTRSPMPSYSDLKGFNQRIGTPENLLSKQRITIRTRDSRLKGSTDESNFETNCNEQFLSENGDNSVKKYKNTAKQHDFEWNNEGGSHPKVRDSEIFNISGADQLNITFGGGQLKQQIELLERNISLSRGSSPHIEDTSIKKQNRLLYAQNAELPHQGGSGKKNLENKEERFILKSRPPLGSMGQRRESKSVKEEAEQGRAGLGARGRTDLKKY
jgi:hypothetical protein